MTILITGSAGFIGFHLCKRLLNDGEKVIGLDNINDYYDQSLKKARTKILNEFKDSYTFIKENLEDKHAIENLFSKYKPEIVVNLAAQAGVRYSLKNPHSYVNSNLVGFLNILEGCRHHKVNHLIYASSSSVYGGNKNIPFSESHRVDHPISLYAASKKANELMAHSYSHLFNIPTTGLRFFTVYGPWGRPDMALFLFTKAMLDNEPIKVFNQGKMSRDFTYIDDIIESIVRLTKKPPTNQLLTENDEPNSGESWAPYKILNIGNSNPTPLMRFIEALEKSLGIKAKKEYLPMQPGDVSCTASNTEALEKLVDFKPNTSVELGIEKFIAWYKSFYKIEN